MLDTNTKEADNQQKTAEDNCFGPKTSSRMPGCEYNSGPSNAAHATSHQAPSRATQAAAVEKVKRPVITSSGDWQYFKSRWDDCRQEPTELLECCDDQLRKDLTRGTL